MEIVTFVTDDPERDLKELADIMLKLRHYTKIWQEHFGATHKDNKVRWEKKADEWLDKHKKKFKIIKE